MKFPRTVRKNRGKGGEDLSKGGFTTRQMTAVFVAMALAAVLASPAARAATAGILSVAITDPSHPTQQAHVDPNGNLQVGGTTTLLAHGENVPIPSNMTTVIVPDLDVSADREIRLWIKGDFPSCNLAFVTILAIPPAGTATYLVDDFGACTGISQAIYEVVGMTVRIEVTNEGSSNDGTVSFFLVGRSN